jgi:hypothetical protein
MRLTVRRMMIVIATLTRPEISTEQNSDRRRMPE